MKKLLLLLGAALVLLSFGGESERYPAGSFLELSRAVTARLSESEAARMVFGLQGDGEIFL